MGADTVISIRRLTGEVLTMHISADSTALHVKELLETERGIPVDQTRLIFNGRQLDDEQLLADVGVVHGSELMAISRLRGD